MCETLTVQLQTMTRALKKQNKKLFSFLRQQEHDQFLSWRQTSTAPPPPLPHSPTQPPAPVIDLPITRTSHANTNTASPLEMLKLLEIIRHVVSSFVTLTLINDSEDFVRCGIHADQIHFERIFLGRTHTHTPHTRARARAHARTHTHVRTHAHTRTHTHARTHTHTHIHTSTTITPT